MENKNISNLEQNLYNSYISMRRNILNYDGNKYENLDSYIGSKEFKAGFFAGIRIMLSLFLDNNDDI